MIKKQLDPHDSTPSKHELVKFAYVYYEFTLIFLNYRHCDVIAYNDGDIGLSDVVVTLMLK